MAVAKCALRCGTPPPLLAVRSSLFDIRHYCAAPPPPSRPSPASHFELRTLNFELPAPRSSFFRIPHPSLTRSIKDSPFRIPPSPRLRRSFELRTSNLTPAFRIQHSPFRVIARSRGPRRSPRAFYTGRNSAPCKKSFHKSSASPTASPRRAAIRPRVYCAAPPPPGPICRLPRSLFERFSSLFSLHSSLFSLLYSIFALPHSPFLRCHTVSPRKNSTCKTNPFDGRA